MSPKQTHQISYSLIAAVHQVTSVSLLHRMSRAARKRKHDRSSSSSSDSFEKDKVRKRRVTHVASTAGECIWCHTKKTAQWRKGPGGPRTLCNACGLEWAKLIRIEARQLDSSNAVAEENLIANYKDSDKYKKSAKARPVDSDDDDDE